MAYITLSTSQVRSLRYNGKIAIVKKALSIQISPVMPSQCFWVREVWATRRELDQTRPRDLNSADPVWYKAGGFPRYNGSIELVPRGRWRSPVVMPRKLSRFNVRCISTELIPIGGVWHWHTKYYIT